MQILVIEDEKLAADRLISLISELEPSSKIVKSLESVRTAVQWLNNNACPDLIFMDVQLADGLCFEIFDKTKIESPVIFTTAYNEYALRAFKVNSIDYLLKPIDKTELKASLQKYRKLSSSSALLLRPELLQQVITTIKNPYKSRFIVRIGEHIKAIGIEDVSYFYTNDKSSFLRTLKGRDFAIDCSLDHLEKEIDPAKFFRVSRKYIVALQHINDIVVYSGNRLKLMVTCSENSEILVSRERVNDFKIWLEGRTGAI